MGSAKMSSTAAVICDSCGETITGEVCHLYYVTPNGQPREHAVMDTVCMSMETERAFRLDVEESTPATPKRTAAEARRNAKAQRAYLSLIDLGSTSSAPHLERFQMASQSQAGVTYIVTHDMVSDRYHCSCPAGMHERACCHVDAAKRFVGNRRAAYERLNDPLVQARYEDEQAQRDTSVRRSNGFQFWA